MVDPILALREFLLADLSVTTEIGSRVYGGELPKNQVSSMPVKAIVVNLAPGASSFGGGYQEFSDIAVDTTCYGATPHEAFQVWRVLYPALKQMRRNIKQQAMLHWANRSAGPLPLRDPDTDWPFIFGSWQVLFAEITAA